MAEQVLPAILSPIVPWASERWLKDPGERHWAFKKTVARVRSFIEELEPVVARLDHTNLEMDRTETSELVGLIRKGKELLDGCSEGNELVRYVKRSSNVSKLVKLEKSLDGAISVQNLRTACDGAEILRLMRSMSQTLTGVCNEIVTSSNGEDDGLRVIGTPCEAPKPPKFTVGFELVMEDLREKILEEKGSKVLVLTGPPGFGKTTLAQMLCHDEKIKGKFNTNIIFVTVSETTDLHPIVGNLYSRSRSRPLFQLRRNEDASEKLRIVMEEIGKRPLLLVLDDVWPGSEKSVITKFTNLDLPDYKILLTSRSEFPRFGESVKLEKLNKDDSFHLFCHHACSNVNIPDKIKNKVVSLCKNTPLVLELIGTLLCGQQEEIWESKLEEWSSDESAVLESDETLVEVLSKSLELLPKKEKLKECFIDLCSFPEDQRIAATILIDVWTELHSLPEKGATANVYHLLNSNLARLVITRSDADEKDGDYSEHFLTPHDMLRKLAISESRKEDSQTKRLIVHLRGNDRPDISKSQDARLVSITTNGSFPSEWCNIQLTETEVLILNFKAESYEIPEFVKSMTKLKLLILTNQSYFKAKLTNFELLNSLADLKTIRLEGIDIASLSQTEIQLKNLCKLSLVMCKIGQSFDSGPISELLKGLVELNIHYCNDCTTLPSGLNKLKKLRVTRCHRLFSLPQDIGEMENLEELNLRSCIGLEKLPESICKLSTLNSLGISECFSVRDLPERIGDLRRLEKLNIKGCSRLQSFPESILKLEESLKDVACDEDMKELLESHLTLKENMIIRVPKEYINLNAL